MPVNRVFVAVAGDLGDRWRQRHRLGRRGQRHNLILREHRHELVGRARALIGVGAGVTLGVRPEQVVQSGDGWLSAEG